MNTALTATFAPTPNPLKQLVLNSVRSPLTKTMYGIALDKFFAWVAKREPCPTFDRATVQEYQTELEASGLNAATVNQKLSAIRKLAQEMAYNKMLDASTAQGIREIRGPKMQGTRTGNWLTKAKAEHLINAPDVSTLKGKRDRAILMLMIGCGLRREEVARVTLGHVQERDSRFCIVDLVGKHGRVRTVPMPAWAKTAIDEWTAAAKIGAGRVFRGINKGGNLTGESLSSQGVWRCVAEYSAMLKLNVSAHDLRRTHAKLAYKGGAKLDQIQLALGHASLVTTERYLGTQQSLTDAPADYLHLDLSA
jgi:integrase/recombinase XerD